ncbi:hypothetical protein SDRG_09918 [Saprolegnia diclina VS20]|nr:hypothetical protein SDRG_09918 [Saprolegnia diclina VS20]EQC32605.1 hypothetical protein SDRG_09918 [Saprolegnia diclina VS20]|eukprot:XP_008614106.1 hypothetical protein SDRG_09918 [Saprolegnia diclina VS20]
MVGFGRKKSTSNAGSDTALDRKGKVDGSSLLDGNGDPTGGALFGAEVFDKKVKRESNNDDDDVGQENKKPNKRWFRLPGLKRK